MKKIKETTAVIVGATGDIGMEMAGHLHHAGANVVLVGRNEAKLNTIGKSLGNERVLSSVTDCSDVNQVKSLLESTINTFGGAHLLITSVGTWAQISSSSSVEEFANQLKLDTDSILQAAALPIFVFNQYFTQKGRGLIVDISSHAAEGFLPGNLTYAPAKVAMKTFVANLRKENDENSGVRISRIIAQLVDTPKNRNAFPLLKSDDWAKTVQIKDMADWVISHLNDKEIPTEQLFTSDIIL